MKIVALAILVLSLNACGIFSDPAKIAAVIDCGKDMVRSEAARIMPLVVTALDGSAPDWQAELAALEANGVEALACALAKVVASDKTPAATMASVPDSMPAGRAARYLADRQWHVSSVSP